MKAHDARRRFWRTSAAGVFFQGGAAAVDSSTIIAALVHGLTGSVFAVGAEAAILRYGWLFPQLFVAYFAQRRERRMPFYMLGAFGRATCLATLAGVLAVAEGLPAGVVTALFFGLWINYPRAFLTVRRQRSSRCASKNRTSFLEICPNFVLE